MAKKKNPNVCIRICRDEAQIHRSRARLEELDVPLADLAGALSLAGNKVRLKILLLLAEERSLCVCDLSEILGMTVPAVSQHLKKLREGGLVFPEPDGVTVYYHIATAAKPTLAALFQLLGVAYTRRQGVSRAETS